MRVGVLVGPAGSVEVADEAGGVLAAADFVFVEAPTLEFAEDVVGTVVEELLECSELLSDWTVASCEVQLHPKLTQESLEAADGPDAPPDDPVVRRARHTEAALESVELAEEADGMQDTLRSMAVELRSFGPGSFGVLDDVDEGDEEQQGDYDFSISPDDAELAAGALVHGMHLLVDELFQDLHALMKEETSVAECGRPMWLLDELPERYALQYDAHFARRFLVTAIAMTTSFTNGSFQPLSCIAEELALKLLLRQATVTLDLYGLLDSGVSEALDAFADGVYEDMDFEWLYDDSKDGIDEDPAVASLGIAPMSITSWFTPFNKGRFVHPYAADEPEGAGAQSEHGG